MPGDINECLEHARRCAELACTANDPEERAYFADLGADAGLHADEARRHVSKPNPPPGRGTASAAE